MEAIRCPIDESHHFLMPDPEFAQLRCPKCGFAIYGSDIAGAVISDSIDSLVRQRAKEFREKLRLSSTPTK